MAMVSTSFLLNEDTVDQAKKLFANMGLDLSMAVDLFLRQSVREQRFPFTTVEAIPNRDTMEAIAEVAEMEAHPENYKSYATFQELLDDVLGDSDDA